MGDRHDDLRSLAEDIKADAGRVHDIEDETTHEEPTSDRFRDLSAEGERITRVMALKASAQRELASQLRDDADDERDGRTPVEPEPESARSV